MGHKFADLDGLWAAVGLMLRVHVNTLDALEFGVSIFPDDLPDQYFTQALEED